MVHMWRLRQEEGVGSLAACEALTTGRGEGGGDRVKSTGSSFLPCALRASCPCALTPSSVSAYPAPFRKNSDGPWCLSYKAGAKLPHTCFILLCLSWRLPFRQFSEGDIRLLVLVKFSTFRGSKPVSWAGWSPKLQGRSHLAQQSICFAIGSGRL